MKSVRGCSVEFKKLLTSETIMASKKVFNTVKQYIESLPEERQVVILTLMEVIRKNIPSGFQECINYGMIGYVVPHVLYPDGYHCDPSLPLPFINVASQKNHVGFYHMGIYSDDALLQWFKDEYAKVCKYKLDMGKSCIRFKKMDDIPFELLGELVKKITVKQWVETYERAVKSK